MYSCFNIYRYFKYVYLKKQLSIKTKEANLANLKTYS